MSGRAWRFLGGLQTAVDVRVPVPHHVAACGELRVMLHSVAGQRTVWTVVGHWSQGWRSGVVPVQSPSEFQVSEATLGCRVPSGGAGCPPHVSPPEIPSSPADHL